MLDSQNTLSLICRCFFNPGLEEAAGGKLKIISGNYLKVYDISRRLFKTPLLQNCHLRYDIGQENIHTRSDRCNASGADFLSPNSHVRFQIFVSADKVSGRKSEIKR